MIESVEGEVRNVDESGFTLAAGPVTLRVLCSRPLLAALAPGMRVSLPAYLQVQIEGNRVNHALMAFSGELERDLFEALITVSGIGPRAAVKAIARPAEEMVSAIASGDEKFLSTLPGIGKAKARQIVASLGEKFAGRAVPAAGGSHPVSRSQSAARAILLQLGLTAAEADGLLAEAAKTLGRNADDSELVREAMRLRTGR
ncbi:hypothetical protein GX411_09960 [Candidatus Fermentibacteria bacterium]|nr:hypothetical protein [Candidatus Fermentibacteria bacterium]